MQKILTLKCPAKLNLSIKNVSKLANGYHYIDSVIVMLNLYDDLIVKLDDKAKSSTTISVIYNKDLRSQTPIANNILYKVISALKLKNVSLDIVLKKNIPMSSGFGGASSNAACLLIALNNTLKLGISNRALMQLGLSIGSDIPYFLQESSTAHIKGYGLDIEALSYTPKNYLLVIDPKIEISTRELFHKFDTIGNYKDNNELLFYAKLINQRFSSLFSDLSKIAKFRMSGSGSGVYLESDNKDDLLEIYNIIPRNCLGYIVKSIKYNPFFA